MSKLSSVPWWSSLGFGKRAEEAEHDYADMGTAFGLDASMDTLPAPDESSTKGVDAGRPTLDGTGRPFPR